MIEIVGTQLDLLGECPVWDGRIDRLYSIDIDGRSVHRFDPLLGLSETHILEGRPGSMALTDDPTVVLVAVEDQLVWLDWSSGRIDPWVDLDTGGPRNRLNDGACDRMGRFWVGTMHEDAEETTGLLYRIQVTGDAHAVRSGVGVPNGLAFSPNGTTMYYADSLADTVWAYDYDLEQGTPSAERVLTDFSNLPGTADGATVDEDGCYWIACVFGSAIARLTPRGAVDRVIEVPVDKPTKPAFGGSDLEVLYVTSIGGGGTHRRYDEPGANGLLLAIDVGVRGVPEPRVEIT